MLMNVFNVPVLVCRSLVRPRYSLSTVVMAATLDVKTAAGSVQDLVSLDVPLLVWVAGVLYHLEVVSILCNS